MSNKKSGGMKMRDTKLIVTMVFLLGSVRLPAEEVTPAIDYPSHSILFQDGKLSLQVDDILLDQLIDEIAYQAGFTFTSYVELDERVSFTFQYVPLGIALKRLLRNHGHMIHFDNDSKVNSGTDSSALVKSLWIMPRKGDAQPFSSNDRDSGYNISDTYRLIQPVTTIGSDDSIREDEIADLGQFNDSHALGELSQALADQDSDIRLAAIESLAERGDVAAVKALAIALADVDPEVREEAVYALDDIGGDAAIVLLKQALGDSVDFVRDAAAEVLLDMDRE